MLALFDDCQIGDLICVLFVCVIVDMQVNSSVQPSALNSEILSNQFIWKSKQRAVSLCSNYMFCTVMIDWELSLNIFNISESWLIK